MFLPPPTHSRLEGREKWVTLGVTRKPPELVMTVHMFFGHWWCRMSYREEKATTLNSRNKTVFSSWYSVQECDIL